MSQTASAEVAAQPEGERLDATSFVINLTASTTPVVLSQPRSAELKRFTFFVSRRREEGRERFRLHMGYFATSAEAEQMLALVRDVYPAAWVGPAPGGRLAPAAKPAAAKVTALRAIEPAPFVDASMLDASPVAATVDRIAVTAQPAKVAPVPAKPAVRRAAPPAAAVVPAAPAAAVATAAVPTLTVPVATASIAPAPVAPAPVVTAAVAPAPVAPVAEAPAELTLVPEDPLERMSNVKEVLAALEDPSPAPAAKHVVPEPKTSKPANPVAAKAPAAASAAPAGATAVPAAAMPATAAAAADISDSQVMRILEQNASHDGDAAGIRLVTPEDTQTLRLIKHELQHNAQLSYAVQLAWSVQPLDMTVLPQLAIFDAYKLYAVEGNRQGRRWYGLRLGFFSDAAAAKQVAWYVRGDFPSVAVVPVTQTERERAGGEPPQPAAAKPATATRHAAAPELENFELLAQEKPTPAGIVMPTEQNAAERLPPEPARRRRGNGPPRNMEETLEILGATTLTLEKSTTILDDSGLGKPKPKSARSSRFAKLLEKLSERLA